MHRTLVAGMIAMAGVAAFAHEGVKDPGVKARMDNMGSIRASMAVLGDMAKGKTAFDAVLAAKARADLILDAGAVTSVFETPYKDPESEALPAIWNNWIDFQSRAVAFRSAADALDTSSLESVRAGLGRVGGTCKGCHEVYRQKK